ncbi:MAG: hypothetical protein KJN97_09745 [Deltaproteobacteria bacterium]|nr:hypothetical protein [Deltaproteobacteria bacterium]
MGLGTGVGGIAADALGNLYYTFVFMNSESEHSFAVRVGKMTPSGSEAWTSLIDGYEHEYMSSLAVGRGKTAAVYVSATSTSQMPGHPPAAKGHPVVAKFGTNGKTTWLKQSASFGTSQSHGVRMAADLSGNVYILPINTSDIGNTILKLDNQGTVVWQATLVVPRDRSRASLSNLEVSPDGKSIYVLGTKDNSLLVIKLDPSGRQQWVRITETRHSVVLDPVEGVRWDGTGRRLSSLYASASNEALYVAFPYWNTYVHGSRPREPHTDVLVAAFNQASGKLQWARQYGLSSTGQQRGNLEYIQAMPNGELVVAAKIPTKPPGYDLNHAVFRLRPSGDPVTPTQPAKAPSKKAK